VNVGRNKLYLLDANDFANTAAHRGITSELYGGDPEMRLKQEIVLGIGGWRLLRELGLHPEVCHLNEGHAAFAVLERARCYMEDHRVPFEVAFTIVRAGNMFTTHTRCRLDLTDSLPNLCANTSPAMRRTNSPFRWSASLLWKAERGKCVGALQHGLPGAARQRSG